MSSARKAASAAGRAVGVAGEMYGPARDAYKEYYPQAIQRAWETSRMPSAAGGYQRGLMDMRSAAARSGMDPNDPGMTAAFARSYAPAWQQRDLAQHQIYSDLGQQVSGTGLQASGQLQQALSNLATLRQDQAELQAKQEAAQQQMWSDAIGGVGSLAGIALLDRMRRRDQQRYYTDPNTGREYEY